MSTGGIHRYAERAKQGRLWRERLGRVPIVLLVPVIPALYLAFYRQKRELVVPLLGAGIYFLLYNGYFFIRGLRWSLSVFNEEGMIPGFLTRRVVEAAVSLLIATLVVGMVKRGRAMFETAKAAVNTSFFVGLGLLLQVDLFFWLYGLNFDWCLPNLKWGFKYYLDLLQLFPTGLAALMAPFTAIAAKAITDRITLLRAR